MIHRHSPGVVTSRRRGIELYECLFVSVICTLLVCCRSIYFSILVGLIVFVITDISVDSKRLTSFAGMMSLILFGFLTSNNPSKVSLL